MDFCTFTATTTQHHFLTRDGIGEEPLQGFLEIKDTHRPWDGPMLLGIEPS